MSDPYVGEIRMFAGTFAPEGWLDCNGQTLQLRDYEALASLLGTTYGGDGQSTFALPDLQSRVPVGTGGGYSLGATGGAETVTVSSQQVPVHTHPLMATLSGQQQSPENAVPAYVLGSYNLYGPKTTSTTLTSASVGNGGGSGPHNNIQPYIGMRFIICFSGNYPPRP